MADALEPPIKEGHFLVVNNSYSGEFNILSDAFNVLIILEEEIKSCL